MPESITSRVLDALANAGLLTIEQITSITEAAAAGNVTPGAVLTQRGMVTPADVESAMEEELGIPRVDLSSYAPDDDALLLIPVSVARARNVLPMFEIEGMLTVAIGDAMDVFELDSLSAELGLEVEAVLSDSASVKAAILQYYGDVVEAPEPVVETPAQLAERLLDATPESILAEEPQVDVTDFFEAPVEQDMPVVTEAPLAEEQPAVVEVQTIEAVVETAAPEGPPAIDLDVLAVADARKVAVLVSDILEHAVLRGANRIQLLPYKDDFFLVYRVHGRLEKIASAPLSMQGALVEGFKNFARLSSVQSTRPALGRVKSRIGDRDLVVTVSAVPTIAGQRVVISVAADKAAPRGLAELGMNEAEVRALHAMIERGKGILLVCAPVAGGRSSTYYALLQHAAHFGKTVYSVERSIDYEIPAVSQVLVSPGSPVGAEGYFAAGIRQDTDVIAIDSMQSVEDVHLAVEAAGVGKLVIATYSGGDIVSGVRRMLDVGVEPVSLASALTLGVGQRLVRMNCPHCSVPQKSPLADRIPGAEAGTPSKRGSGCPACANTGFQGATGIFEVLPFTEPVRAPISRGATAEQIADSVRAAGLRPMVASGLAKVKEGLVSPEELNRVLRFTE
ncbi:MAG: ATPase, T2SS/T4P/T4SS family [Actinomycetota bacterium]|nr:ATPase, T2SS/T4P/T4SS family [Actinomycetota bacterium]